MGRSKTPLFAVVDREAERIKHNPAYRFMLFVGPMLGILILYFIFHSGSVKNIPIAVVNQDNSSVSVKIENAIDATPDVAVTVHAHDMFQARKFLEDGEVEAIVLIPTETEKAVFNGTEAPIPLYVNGTNVLKSSLIQRAVLGAVRTISGGVELKKLMGQGMTEKEAMARIMPVKIDKHVLFNPYTNYNYFLGSALVYVMLYLFVFLSSIYTLGNELKRGTGLDLLETSNGSVRLAVLGKLFPYTIIFMGIAMFINLLYFRIEGMPLNGNFLILFFGQFLTIVSYQLLGIFFIAATSNLRLALSLASAYSMMAITFSGLTFPLEAMPQVAQWFATIFPFTWWEKLVISQALRGAPLSEALPYVAYLLIFQVIGLSFIYRYKRLLANPKAWGKG